MRVAGEPIARQAGIENGALAAGTAELQGGGEAGKAAADDDDVIHGTVATAFTPLLMAHSAVVAGSIANHILHEGATLPNYKYEILSLAVFLLALVLGPLCVFTPNLHAARLAGLRTYGRLVSDYVLEFADKWAQGPIAADGEHILGSADIQSLADLG